MESSRRQQSLLLDLAVGLYVLGAGVATLFSIGWASAPYENADPDSTHELVLIGLAVGALAAAVAMARAFLAGNSSRTRPALVISLTCLAGWVVALPPI